MILNEQLIGGDGRDVAAIIVRAVRLQITEPSLFDLPARHRPDPGPRGGRRAGRRRDPPGRGRADAGRHGGALGPDQRLPAVDVSLGNGNGDNDNFTSATATTTVAPPLRGGGGGGGGGGTSTPVKIIT